MKKAVYLTEIISRGRNTKENPCPFYAMAEIDDGYVSRLLRLASLVRDERLNELRVDCGDVFEPTGTPFHFQQMVIGLDGFWFIGRREVVGGWEEIGSNVMLFNSFRPAWDQVPAGGMIVNAVRREALANYFRYHGPLLPGTRHDVAWMDAMSDFFPVSIKAVSMGAVTCVTDIGEEWVVSEAEFRLGILDRSAVSMKKSAVRPCKVLRMPLNQNPHSARKFGGK